MKKVHAIEYPGFILLQFVPNYDEFDILDIEANPNARNDAGYIVEATNNHEKLKEALEAILANSTDIHIVEQTAREALSKIK